LKKTLLEDLTSELEKRDELEEKKYMLEHDSSRKVAK